MDYSDVPKAKTDVFWDLEDFPVPVGGSIDSFPMKIKRSLFIEGYRGDVKFIVYSGKKSVKSKDHLRFLGMDLDEADEKRVRLHTMLMDIVARAYHNPPTIKEPVNFIVIAKDDEEAAETTEFVPTLGKLKEKGYNVFLVVPDDCSTLDQASFPDANLVWHWNKLFDGHQASEFYSDSGSDSDSDCEVSSHM